MKKIKSNKLNIFKKMIFAKKNSTSHPQVGRNQNYNVALKVEKLTKMLSMNRQFSIRFHVNLGLVIPNK